MKATELLRSLAKPSALGPSPSFNEFQLSKTLEVIGEGSIGRTALSHKLQIGEGATRTIIDHLHAAGIIDVRKSGAVLTKKGQRVLNELNVKLGKKVRIEGMSIAVGTCVYGIQVKGSADKVRVGIEQRDAAVRAGALGAVTVVFKKGRLYVPPADRSPPEEWTRDRDKILEVFAPSEGDVIIICGAASERDAESGARAAAWTLLD